MAVGRLGAEAVHADSSRRSRSQAACGRGAPRGGTDARARNCRGAEGGDPGRARLTIVVDTTVLVYALGSAHPLREPCRRVIAAIRDGALTATTTIDAIQEFAHAYARRRPRPTGVAHARRYLTLLAPLLSPTYLELEQGLKLFADHERLDAFDAVLAATAVAQDAAALVSADQAFSSVRRLRHVVPGTPEFDRLLES